MSFAETPAQSSTKVGTTCAFPGNPIKGNTDNQWVNDAKYLMFEKPKWSCGSRVKLNKVKAAIARWRLRARTAGTVEMQAESRGLDKAGGGRRIEQGSPSYRFTGKGWALSLRARHVSCGTQIRAIVQLINDETQSIPIEV
ncbi:MAG: hypothetical protein H0U97_22435 [Gammaproteobacteria bacterium]|nr:hypothetical protein [Gammaproteobacteria bacterium]